MNEEKPDSSEIPRQPEGLEMMCAGILGTQFGRRKSSAVAKAMIRLRAEEAAAPQPAGNGPASWRERIVEWSRRLQPGARFALATALIAITGLAARVLWSEGWINLGRPQNSGWIYKVSDSLQARWAGKSAKAGDTPGTGWLRLESGVVEITYASGATVAIEGPARFRAPNFNVLELTSGKISADVPKRARGFSVKSPTATVVDLGTRFGEIVNSASEVDVFQGAVELSAASRSTGGPWRLSQSKGLIVDPLSAVPAAALPESAFPQPNLTVLARPQNCGFDVSARAVLGGVPSDFGYWSGPAFALVAPVQNIRPFEGAGMLRFLTPAGNPAADSEVWQLIDLRSFKKFLAHGGVEARLDSMFNRIPADERFGQKFGLALAAFRGPPIDSKFLWAERATTALVTAAKELTADNDPATWEKIEISVKLPPETDFVIVEICAVAPKTSKPVAEPFPGNFADRVDLKLCAPLRASAISTSR